METLYSTSALQSNASASTHPRTPPYVPARVSKRRLERSDSPSTNVGFTLPTEISSPVKKAVKLATTDDIHIEELAEGDGGYETDIEAVYPNAIEENSSDSDDHKAKENHDPGISHHLRSPTTSSATSGLATRQQHIVTHIEEPEEDQDKNAQLHTPQDYDPAVAITSELLLPPRKRGRPRKAMIGEPSEVKKSSHARSKTSCGTCRRRKKKCDETKPVCTNCEKINVVCDGYDSKRPWGSGKVADSNQPDPALAQLKEQLANDQSDLAFVVNEALAADPNDADSLNMMTSLEESIVDLKTRIAAQISPKTGMGKRSHSVHAENIVEVSESQDADAESAPSLQDTKNSHQIRASVEDLLLPASSHNLHTSPALDLASRIARAHSKESACIEADEMSQAHPGYDSVYHHTVMPLAMPEPVVPVAVQQDKLGPSMIVEASSTNHASGNNAKEMPGTRTIQGAPATLGLPRLRELQNIISDLQERTESLLRQTRPGRRASTERDSLTSSRLESSRSHSSPPSLLRLRRNRSAPPGRNDYELLRPEQTLESMRDDPLSSPTPSQSVCSDGAASYNRSERSLSSGFHARARSEPPTHRRSYARGEPRRHNKETAPTESPNANQNHHPCQSNVGRTSHKRETAHDQRQPSDGHDQNSERLGPKRRRVADRGDEGTDKERYPCIFHAGEPTVYSNHNKRYAFISQLLRHLRRHDFYACAKCFTKFDDEEARDMHTREDPCRKSCTNRRCTRHLPSGTVRESVCQCIRSPEQQWRQIFLLQYPNLPIPDLAYYRTQDTAVELNAPNNDMSLDDFWNDLTLDFNLTTSNHGGTHDAALDEAVYTSIEPTHLPGDDIAPNNASAQLGNETINSQQSAARSSGTGVDRPDQTSNGATQPPTTIQIDETFFAEVQGLRQRVLLLEQRLSRPTVREQDLEMVIGNVWQALVRTGSADAQPESPIWRLVRRFAGSVLSTIPSASGEDQPLAAPNVPSSFQWQTLLGSCVPSATVGARAGAESGYESLP